MGCPQSLDECDPGNRERWAFVYKLVGDLRFISHRDTLRLFSRAFARASVPVRFTQGFNPHPRISMPLPRPVGVASHAETLVAEFERQVDGDEVLGKLDGETPGDIEMIGARRLQKGERLQPDLVRYRLELDPGTAADVESRIRRILQSDVIAVQRVSRKEARVRHIDARPFLEDMHVDEGVLEFTLRVTPAGTVKPAEIAGLLGYDVHSVNHRIVRLDVRWVQVQRSVSLSLP